DARAPHRTRTGRRATARPRRGAEPAPRRPVGSGPPALQRPRAEPPCVSRRLDCRRRRRDEDRRQRRLPAGESRHRSGSGRRHRQDRDARGLAMTTLTPANQLTLLRMLLIPAFVILVVYGQLGWALAVFVTAGVTDLLDGLIARWSGQKTSLGAWLDPMADK